MVQNKWLSIKPGQNYNLQTIIKMLAMAQYPIPFCDAQGEQNHSAMQAEMHRPGCTLEGKEGCMCMSYPEGLMLWGLGHNSGFTR